MCLCRPTLNTLPWRADLMLIAKSAASACYFTALLKGREARPIRAQICTKQEIQDRLKDLVNVAEDILRFSRGL